jgi:hypothetical protein
MIILMGEMRRSLKEMELGLKGFVLSSVIRRPFLPQIHFPPFFLSSLLYYTSIHARSQIVLPHC